jgi:hypothetical protein
MSKNKSINISVANSKQELIYWFLKQQDRTIVCSIWDALYQVYWLPALFEKSDEFDQFEKVKGSIETISRIEGELVKAKLLARELNFDLSVEKVRDSIDSPSSRKEDNLPINNPQVSATQKSSDHEKVDSARVSKISKFKIDF